MEYYAELVKDDANYEDCKQLSYLTHSDRHIDIF